MTRKRKAICDECGETFKMRETSYLMETYFLCPKCKNKRRKKRR